MKTQNIKRNNTRGRKFQLYSYFLLTRVTDIEPATWQF